MTEGNTASIPAGLTRLYGSCKLSTLRLSTTGFQPRGMLSYTHAHAHARARTCALVRTDAQTHAPTGTSMDARPHGHKHGCTAHGCKQGCAHAKHMQGHTDTHTPPPPPPPPPPGGAAALSSRTWLCVVTCSASRSRQGRSWCQPASTSLKSRGRASQVGRVRQWAGGNGSRKRLPAPKTTGSKAVHVRFLNPRNFYQWHMSCSNPCTTGSSATGQKQFMCDW